jgi:hypothetical protein
MPTQKPRLSDQTGRWLGSFVSVVTNLVAVPIKELHLTIGHSFVSGMTVLGLILGGVGLYGLELQQERLGPVLAAQVQMQVESTESARLRNAATAAELGQGVNRASVWNMVAVNTNDADRTLSIEFPPVEGSEQLLVSWKIASTQTIGSLNKEGLIMAAVPSGAIANITIPWSTMWNPGDGISLTMEQLTNDGRRVRSTQVRHVRLQE